MKRLGQPYYALLELTKDGYGRYWHPVQIYGATDTEAIDAAKDKIWLGSRYVLVRLVADFENGLQVAEYNTEVRQP